MKPNYTRLLLMLLFFSPCIHAQMGIGTSTPSPHAILDVVSSTGKGVLLPRLNAAQQATLQGLLGAGQTGMLVLDSASGKIVYWTGSNTTSWKDLSTTTITATTPLSVSSINNISLNPGTAVGDLITWDGNNWVNMQPDPLHFTLTQNNMQPSLVLNYCIALQGVFPSRTSDLPFLSEIQLFSFNYAPKGWALCNGQILSIAQNQALFSLMGTTYGGTGVTTFALPDLRGRVPIHMGQGAGLSSFVEGQAAGTESNTITR